MTLSSRLLFLCSLVSALGLVSTPPKSANASVADCPAPALSRFRLHKVTRGETLESIAQHYKLMPATIMTMNPALNKGMVPVGRELQIPPYDGIVVEVPPHETWRDLAIKYKIRADTLFELNGCQKNPKIVFIPKLGSSNRRTTQSLESTRTSITISGYPLPKVVKVALPYGWQTNPMTGEVFFNTGVDLLAPVGTPVQAIAPGTVVLAKDQGSYGKLVIINHSGGFQSRYAQLDNIQVTVGQKVNKGDVLGTVGTTGKPNFPQPHLHFEIRSSSSVGWVAQDPKNYLQN